jgi:methionyl-tRNA formyltransferase
VTLAPKLQLEDGHIDWSADAPTVFNRIRGVTPEPGAFTMIDDIRIKILEAAIAENETPLPPGQLALGAGRVLVGTATTPLELVVVHPAGKKAMRASDWWRGRSAAETAVAT